MLARKIIEISGSDGKKFLQGLITNDIEKISTDHLIYTAMLNNKGQFLYDFFIFVKDDKILLDCALSKCDEIIKKFNFYKLRADVKIEKNDEILIAQTLENIGFADPRCKNLGFRIYQKKEGLEKIKDKLLDEKTYHFLRIENKIAEGEFDLTFEKSFIQEFAFDNLGAINYEKGCFVGQEFTARTHHLGEIRKKLFHIKIENFNEEHLTNFISLKNHEISCQGKKLGVILSSVFYKDQLHALALLRISDYENRESDEFEAENLKILVVS